MVERGVPPSLIQLIKIDVANPGFVIVSMLRYICMCVLLATEVTGLTPYHSSGIASKCGSAGSRVV